MRALKSYLQVSSHICNLSKLHGSEMHFYAEPSKQFTAGSVTPWVRFCSQILHSSLCCPELHFVLLSLLCTGSKVDFDIKSKVLHLETFVVCILMKNSVSGTFLTSLCLIKVRKSSLSLTCFVLRFWFSQHHLHCKDFAVFRGQMGTIPIMNCALWDTVVHIATFVCSPYFV